MREITTIEIKKTTRTRIQKATFALGSPAIRTPDAYINALMDAAVKTLEELEQANQTINGLNDELSIALEERDDARAHIWQDTAAGETRTVPASGKLSLEKYAGKKVIITVIS